MTDDAKPHGSAGDAVRCNCLVLRQASRHVTQFYDSRLARFGLRTTQFSVLIRLRDGQQWTIHTLAEALVMDRTTLGRNLRPLERDGLLLVSASAHDRRSRVLAITAHGLEVLRQAEPAWQQAQADFERDYGPAEARALRLALADVMTRAIPRSHCPWTGNSIRNKSDVGN